MTGAQRVTAELLARLGPGRVLSPGRLRRPWGHAWEQAVLPARARGTLLFSPCVTGPLAMERQVVQIFDAGPFDIPETMSGAFGAWYRWLLPRLMRRARLVLTSSSFSKERLLACSGVPERKVRVVPLGVDERFFRPAGAPPPLPSPDYVLTLGLGPRKNLSRLLEAWRRVLPSLPKGLWLVLAGEEGDPAVFRGGGLAPLPPRVHRAGRVPDASLPALYRGARAFLFPSRYEGFGLPPLEAMAAGVPVLAGRAASLPEVCGDAALLADPLSTEALAEGLEALVKDERLAARLREAGPRRARAFSWEACAEATAAALEEAA